MNTTLQHSYDIEKSMTNTDLCCIQQPWPSSANWLMRYAYFILALYYHYNSKDSYAPMSNSGLHFIDIFLSHAIVPPFTSSVD